MIAIGLSVEGFIKSSKSICSSKILMLLKDNLIKRFKKQCHLCILKNRIAITIYKLIDFLCYYLDHNMKVIIL